VTGAVLGLLTGLLLAEPVAQKQADSTTWQPGRSRIVLGMNAGGVFGKVSTSTEHGRDRAGGSANTIGLAVEYERRLFQYVSIAAVGSLAAWSGAADQAGYRDQRLDLGVSAHVEALRVMHPGAWLGELYLAVPVGLTVPFAAVPERRAFTEQVDDSPGWYAGGALGITVLFRHWGGRFEACYCRHDHRRRSTITPSDPGQPAIVADTHLIDDQLLFTFAGVFTF
jgi:hypothetical protein